MNGIPMNGILFAQLQQWFQSLPPAMVGLFVITVLFFFTVVMLLIRRYKRCPSNRVLVIYGKFTGSPTGTRCLHGGARLVLPLVQDYAYLNLEPIQIEIPLKGALSIENIRVNVPSVFTVAVGTDLETMQNAAIRLLGLGVQEIKQQAGDIIFGQLRQVVASMSIEDINRDRDKFLHNIQTSLEPELKKIGLVLINVNITDITDESGYIEAIGRKAASQAVQKATVDVAEQEKMGHIGVAEAEREQSIQVANATKVREIGTREATREQAVRLATLDKEQKIGEQSAAFEREAQVKDAERKMRISLADANAKAIAGEATAQADVAAAQAQLQVKQAEAFQLGETRKREADAAVQEAQATAEKAKVIVEAEAEAEKRRIEAEGAAAATFARLDAEARGQYQILAKKGEGLQRIIEACGGSEQAFQLLMLEHLDTLAHTAAQAIANIKFDKVIVWENGANGNGSATASFLQGLSRSLPPMMQILKDIGGVELPEYIARFSDGKTAAETATTAVATTAPTTPAAKPKPAAKP
jgi:flotillin